MKKNLKSMELNRKSNGQFKKGTHWRPCKIFRDKEYLEKEYVINNKSVSQIAKENNVTENAIYFWIKKNNIKTRTMKEIRKNKKWGLPGKLNGMYGRCGCENPRWIDGSSPIRQTMYARSFWKELIKLIYERDNYKCKRCGSKHTGKNKLHAHHIKPWAGNPNSRFELSNIITLCQKCHNYIHSKENINHEYLS